MDNYYDPALEGIFSAETTVRNLLDQVREKLRQNYTTVASAEQVAERMETEANHIRGTILEIGNTMAQVHNGAISSSEAKAVVTPLVGKVKEYCSSLGLIDGLCDSTDITETELEMLNEFINGCRIISEEHIAYVRGLEGSDNAGQAGTLVHGATEGSIMHAIQNGDTEALEGILTNKNTQLLFSTEGKTADALLAQAKALYKTDKAKALKTIKQARAIYSKLINKCKSMGTKMKLTDVSMMDPSTGAYGKTQMTKYNGVLGAMVHYEDRIDTCDAIMLKWNNKAGQKDLAALKKQLKEERKASREAYREQMKARKAEQREAKAQARAAKKEAKAAAKLARKAARDGNSDVAAEALLAMESYEHFGYYDTEGDPDKILLESLIQTMALDEEDYF